MTISGYSDRINHALAFAAKHHDREVRKGTRLPYATRAANVAIILTRYGRDNDTVVAGILNDVVEDCVRDRYSREMLEQRIGDKFSLAVLDTILSVTERLVDDDGVELSNDERRDDCVVRLSQASDDARWICAADALHNTCSLLADLNRTIDPDTVWGRFHAGREGTVRWYRRVQERLVEIGFSGEIMAELTRAVSELEEWRESVSQRSIPDALGQP